MAKLNQRAPLTFCPRVVSNFEEGYNGSLPVSYLPIEFTNLENVMAMFWRVKSWKVDVTRQSIHTPPPAAENYSFVATYADSEIRKETDLVCRNFLRWQFSQEQPFSGGTVQIDGTIDFDENLFVLGGKFYLPVAIRILVGEHKYAGFSLDDGIVFRTEFLGLGALFPADATFSLFNMSSDLLCEGEDATIQVASASCSISPHEFWPYANDDGSSPDYNTSTGARI